MYIEHVHTHKIGAVFNFIVLTHRQVKSGIKKNPRIRYQEMLHVQVCYDSACLRVVHV